MGLLREECAAKMETRESGEGKDEKQAKFKSPDRDQARCVFCPLPQFTYSENGPGRTEQNGGGRHLMRKSQAFFLLCARIISDILRWGEWCWMHSGALKGLCPAQGLILGNQTLTGTPEVTSSGTYIYPGWGGELDSPAAGPLTIPFFVEEVKPLRFMYCVTEKKYKMFSPKDSIFYTL